MIGLGSTTILISALIALGGFFMLGTIVQDNSCKAKMYLADQAVIQQIAKNEQERKEAEYLTGVWRDKAEIQEKTYEDIINEERSANKRLIESIDGMQQGDSKTCSLPETGKPKTPTGDNARTGARARVLSKEDKEFLTGIAFECDQVTKNASLMRGWLNQMSGAMNKRE